jgi:hypothetical protein
MKADDVTLDASQERQVRKYADLLLKKGSAYGRFPTPVTDLVEAADLEIARENALDKVFLGGLYRSLPNALKLAPDRLKKALGKVMGLLDRRDRTVHIDKGLHPKKRVFLSLHEVGHDFLPWQRKTFDVLEDGESELDPETRDRFEREANCFSSDVLFQLDTFTEEAADCSFGIAAPLRLAPRYGASFYATARRYVVTSDRACALLVFDRPKVRDLKGLLTLRRAACSKPYANRFGRPAAPAASGPGSFFFENRPVNKFTAPTPFALRDRNGDRVPGLAEAFDSTYEVFFLVYPLAKGPKTFPAAV